MHHNCINGLINGSKGLIILVKEKVMKVIIEKWKLIREIKRVIKGTKGAKAASALKKQKDEQSPN